MGFDSNRSAATLVTMGLLSCLALLACTPKAAAPAAGNPGEAPATGAGLPAIQYQDHISAGDRAPPGAQL